MLIFESHLQYVWTLVSNTVSAKRSRCKTLIIRALKGNRYSPTLSATVIDLFFQRFPTHFVLWSHKNEETPDCHITSISVLTNNKVNLISDWSRLAVASLKQLVALGHKFVKGEAQKKEIQQAPFTCHLRF